MSKWTNEQKQEIKQLTIETIVKSTYIYKINLQNDLSD